jgi:hypothetical protein
VWPPDVPVAFEFIDQHVDQIDGDLPQPKQFLHCQGFPWTHHIQHGSQEWHVMFRQVCSGSDESRDATIRLYQSRYSEQIALVDVKEIIAAWAPHPA